MSKGEAREPYKGDEMKDYLNNIIKNDPLYGKWEAHCGKPHCRCDHLTSCFEGWRDTDENSTTPCLECRPDTHRRWMDREAGRHKGYGLRSLALIMWPDAFGKSAPKTNDTYIEKF